MKKRVIILFLCICLGIFLVGIVSATPTISLNTPNNGTSFAKSTNLNFSCLFNSDNSTISRVELLYKADYESTFSILKTFNKGNFNEDGQGNNFSVNYLNEYDVSLNPNSIVDGDGNTCGGDNDPCNLFNTSSGNTPGGYWHPTPSLSSATFTMTFNDTFLIHNFYMVQHGTFYSNNSLLEYSLDGTTWTTAFNKTTTATINENFITPFRAKYLKFTSLELASPNNLYVTYVNITGQLLNSSTPFEGNLNYTASGISGGTYEWNCKAYTDVTNVTASSNYSFTMDGTQINWVSPTPSSGNENTNIVVNTSVTSDDDAYSFLNRDNSLIGWWTFDDYSNRLQSVNNVWGNAFTGVGTLTYPSSRFQEGVLIGNSDSITTNLTGNNDLGFTLVWSMNISNSSAFDAPETDWIFNGDYNSVGGFKLRFQNENLSYFRFYILMYNSTGYTNIAPKLTFPKSYLTDFKRYALSVDITNQEYSLYVEGELVSTTSSSVNFNFYDHGDSLHFEGRSYFEALLDDIMFFNMSVTDNEGKLLSNYSKINTLDLDYSSDKNVTIKPYAYDNESVVSTNAERSFNFLQSETISYTHIFNNDNETLWAYCRPSLNGINTSEINISIEYSTDNSTWTNLTETYHANNETYAVIGDSMSNSYEDWDWIGYLTDDFNMSDATLPFYSVSGNTCTQVYNQLVNNVTNGTTNLFVTCGVNGGIPTTNTELWEDIYNEAKSKNISKIYMTTMPPWDVINTYDNSTAQTKCDLQKSQNEWLIDFASDKDDLEVVDLWTFFHDTSGTNKTDCGYRTDITYSDDGVHPNALGMEYWGDEYWKLFNEWQNDTFETSLTPTQTGTYYFRCYTKGSRASSISNMGSSYFYIASDNPVSTTTEEETPPSPGGGFPTYYPTQLELQEGYSKILGKNWKLGFNLENETHELKVNEIQNNSATITISSNPIIFNLSINETKKFDLDDNGFYDISVLLKNITGNNYYPKAEIYIKSINEEISSNKQKENSNQSQDIINKDIALYVLLGIVLIFLIILFITKSKKKKTKRK